MKKQARSRRPRLDIHKVGNQLQAAIGPGAGLEFAKTYFPEAKEELIIGTAYFSLKGYNLARRYISDTTNIRVLVGKRDGLKVQEAVLQEINCELQSVTDINDIYAAVENLYERMKTGRFFIADARQMKTKFHCKLYICHDSLGYEGSANYSFNGLKDQAEQVQVIRDSKQIQKWKAWFDEVAENALDLHEDLIKILRDWLNMAKPFDVYLKSLVHFFNHTSSIKHYGKAHVPIYFQKHLATWAIHQMTDYDGVLLIVATGLGKTIIGSEIASILRQAGEIGKVILIAPRTVHENWKNELDGREIPFRAFDNSVLFKKETNIEHHQVSQLVHLLAEADERTLIVVDEVHTYRNQWLALNYRGGSRVLKRIEKATKQGARIALLTGSIYSTNLQNVNSILSLLPPRNPTALGKSHWQANSHSTLSIIPTVAIFGYAHAIEMARQRGDEEDGHPFLNFEERHYLPTEFESQLVSFDLPLIDLVTDAFEKRCFDQKKKIRVYTYDDQKGAVIAMTDTIFNVSLKGWISSTRALYEDIGKNILTNDEEAQATLFSDQSDNIQRDLWGQPVLSKKKGKNNSEHVGYNTSLRISTADRAPLLRSLLKELKQNYSRPDDKASKLLNILNKHHSSKVSKTIIFVERLTTAIYLEQLLEDHIPSLRVACTVKEPGTQKSSNKRKELFQRFSPISQNYKGPKSTFDVIICTDADGIGINLQDADTVVNYDLTAGVDRLIQRFGRILRATLKRDRQLFVYTFVPAITQNPVHPTKEVYKNVINLYDRLFERHQKSSMILGSRILAKDGSSTTISLKGKIDISALLTAGDLSYDLTNSNKQAIATHLGVLEQYRSEANELPKTLHSARFFNENEPRLVLLFMHDNKSHFLTINPENQRVVSQDKLFTLKLLACSPEEPRAGVLVTKVSYILETANKAIQHWCKRNKIDPDDDVKRLAVLYLMPKSS